MSDGAASAIRAGKLAAALGRGLDANPYPAASAEHAYWVLGFDSMLRPVEDF